jgi:hypothetical protein
MTGFSRGVTSARASIAPRGVLTTTQSPLATPRSPASSGLISTNISGWSSPSQLSKRLIGPLR